MLYKILKFSKIDIIQMSSFIFNVYFVLCSVKGSGHNSGPKSNQSQTMPVLHRAQAARREFYSLFIVPMYVVVRYLHESLKAHAMP